MLIPNYYGFQSSPNNINHFKEQNFIRKLFGEEKDIIIVKKKDLMDLRSLYKKYDDVKIYTLFKDEKSVKKNISDLLPRLIIF